MIGYTLCFILKFYIKDYNIYHYRLEFALVSPKPLRNSHILVRVDAPLDKTSSSPVAQHRRREMYAEMRELMQSGVVARKPFVRRDISPALSSFRHPMHSPERGHSMQMITAAAFIRAAINPGPGEGGGCHRHHRLLATTRV